MTPLSFVASISKNKYISQLLKNLPWCLFFEEKKIEKIEKIVLVLV